MTFVCEECNYETSDKSNLNRHLRSKKHIYKLTNLSTRKIFKCNICEYQSKDWGNYDRHIQTHNKPKLNNISKIIKEMSTLRGKVHLLKKKEDEERDEDKKSEIHKSLVEMNNKLNMIKREYNKVTQTKTE